MSAQQKTLTRSEKLLKNQTQVSIVVDLAVMFIAALHLNWKWVLLIVLYNAWSVGDAFKRAKLKSDVLIEKNPPPTEPPS